MRRFNEGAAIAVLLLVVCLMHFGAAYASTTDPTPAQIVNAIKRAHIEGIAARDPNIASHFIVYGNLYGPHPGDPADAFSLCCVKYLIVNGQHLVLFRYVNGNSAWQDFAFFVGSLNYAGELPVAGPNTEYQSVGQNLIISLHTMRSGDAYCCPSGPMRTIAIFSADSHGLFTSTPTTTPTPATASAATSAHTAAVAALISLERSHGRTDVEGPRCIIVQTYAECAFEIAGGNAGMWALLDLKSATWTFLGDGGEVTYDHGVAQFGSFASMLERQYGIPASVAKRFAAKINDI